MSWTVAGFQMPEVRSFESVLAVGVLATLQVVRQRTRLGRALRATTQNPVAARLLGVDVARVSAIGMGLGVAAAGAAAPAFTLLPSPSPSPPHPPRFPPPPPP